MGPLWGQGARQQPRVAVSALQSATGRPEAMRSSLLEEGLEEGGWAARVLPQAALWPCQKWHLGGMGGSAACGSCVACRSLTRDTWGLEEACAEGSRLVGRDQMGLALSAPCHKVRGSN